MDRKYWLTIALQVGMIPASICSFWVLFPFKIAIALTIVTIFHELGHAIVVRLLGLQILGIYLIPFMGGMIRHTPYKSSLQEFLIIFAGPLGGMLLSMGAFGLAHLIHSDFLWYIGYIAAVLNLVNLLPLPALDGGKLLCLFSGALSKQGSMSYTASTALTCCIMGISIDGIFMLLAGVAIAETIFHWQHEAATVKLPVKFAFLLLPCYVGLAGCLAHLSVYH